MPNREWWVKEERTTEPTPTPTPPAAPLTSAEAQRRISELNKRQQLAQAAEQQRLDEESRHQREIEAAEQELAQLQQQEAAARIVEAVQMNQRYIIEQNTPAVHAVLKALADFEAGKTSFEAVRESAHALDATFQQQRQIAANGLHAANQIANHTYVDNPLLSMDVNARQAADTAGRYIDRFNGALNTHHALMLYVSQGHNDMDTRRRQGFTFALIGAFVQPGQNISLTSLQDQSRREWLTQLRGVR